MPLKFGMKEYFHQVTMQIPTGLEQVWPLIYLKKSNKISKKKGPNFILELQTPRTNWVRNKNLMKYSLIELTYSAEARQE